jgi:hypothetical protein
LFSGLDGNERDLETMQSFFDGSLGYSSQERLLLYITEYLNYPSIDMRSGIAILSRVLECISAFPFEPKLVAKSFTPQGLFRALALLTQPAYLADGHHRRPGKIGRFQGLWVRRIREEEDTKRILFRALATVKIFDSTVSSELTHYRQVPVTNFIYDLFGDSNALHQPERSVFLPNLNFLRQEDERTVDLLDVIMEITAGDLEDLLDRFCKYPARHGYTNVIKTLPSYECYLDQLAIPRQDFVAFVRFIHILAVGPGEIFSVDSLNYATDELCALFGTGDITWKVFHETTATMGVRILDHHHFLCSSYVFQYSLIEPLEKLLDIICPESNEDNSYTVD